MPVEEYVERLNNAKTLKAREEAVRSLGGLVIHENRAAFDALSGYLKDLPSDDSGTDPFQNCHS